MPQRRLLAVFAHPDDETFLAGPVLARYTVEGVDVQLVCATPEEPVSEGGIAAVRRAELQCAAEALGIRRVHHLGYGDSPMSPELGAAPGALVAAPQEEVVERVLKVMEEVKPQVVITDSAYGAYGHPDHVLMHRATASAFAQYAASAGATQKLYALAYPMPLVRLNVRLLRLWGVPVSRLGLRGEVDLPQIIREDYPISARLDVRSYVRYRKEAGRCHRSQIAAAPLPLKLLEASPVWFQTRLFGHLHLTRLHPPHAPGPRETDLFAGTVV
ncbi:MAG: PIG-L family deacetylase [Chloroflexi bacterium]|nr:PIG-L family deacetylase [Chloroflexota bacterium]